MRASLKCWRHTGGHRLKDGQSSRVPGCLAEIKICTPGTVERYAIMQWKPSRVHTGCKHGRSILVFLSRHCYVSANCSSSFNVAWSAKTS